ncbi:hypothetical protein B0H19DRAFT_1274999 [Mycena capillaripes]|nr:hypothetical protein B0H19DRAFT_1274999 [Mycena capillaripes]
MASTLLRTNMTIDEMVPDTVNPAHNPRFWCLPPIRDEPSEGGNRGNFPMYLVTQGKAVGIWHNWTVVKAMVSGHPSGAQHGHQTQEGCVVEWQEHCALGVHPHLADPQRASGQGSARPQIVATSGPPKSRGRLPSPDLQKQLQMYCMPDLSRLTLDRDETTDSVSSESNVPVSSTSAMSVAATTWVAVPRSARYYAIWGGRVVYTNRAKAKAAFLVAEAEGTKPKILSTAEYDEAQDFSESVYYI